MRDAFRDKRRVVVEDTRRSAFLRLVRATHLRLHLRTRHWTRRRGGGNRGHDSRRHSSQKIEDALRDANQRKDDFLAMLAHELRSPPAPIAAAAELLSIDPSNVPRLKQTSQIIGRQVRHLTGLVDDLLDVSRVATLSAYLECFGDLMAIEHNAHSALARATAEPPDLCLLDVGLPAMDGNELARRLRRNPALKATVLIAVSGYGQEEGKHNALSAEFGHHLTKPVDLGYLRTLASQLMQREVQKHL